MKARGLTDMKCESRELPTLEPWHALDHVTGILIFDHKFSDGKVAIKSLYKNKGIRD